MDGSFYALKQGCKNDGICVFCVSAWISICCVDANDNESLTHEGDWIRLGTKVHAAYGRSSFRDTKQSWWRPSGPSWIKYYLIKELRQAYCDTIFI